MERAAGGTRKLRCPNTNTIMTPQRTPGGGTTYVSPDGTRFVTKKF